MRPQAISLSRPKPDLRARASLRTCGDIRALAGDNDVVIYDDIGFFGVSARQVHDALARADGGEVTVWINSYGGDVYDGIAIYNELLAYRGKVRVRVMGIAASAASLIAMAGDTIEIAANAEIMIHNAWTIGLGDADDMRALAERLDQIDGNLAATYSARTGIAAEEVAAMMAADTFLGGSAAVAMGFADSLIALAEPEEEDDDEEEIAASIAGLRLLAQAMNRYATA